MYTKLDVANLKLPTFIPDAKALNFHPTQFHSSLSFYKQYSIMFSRALGTRRAVPALRSLSRPTQFVKRSVTTDAASAHADKDAVPEVGLCFQSYLIWRLKNASLIDSAGPIGR